MSTQLEDLKPQPTHIEVGDKLFSFRLFTLDDHAYIREKYGSINDFHDRLWAAKGEDSLLLFEIMARLSLYHKGEKSFVKDLGFLSKVNPKKLIEATKLLSSAYTQIFEKSSPLYKNVKRMQELAEIQQAAGLIKNEVCYASYYDRLARRYSYSLEQFYSLTLRQLILILKATDDGDFKDLEIEAAIAGRELKPRNEALDVSEEEEQEYEVQQDDLLERMKKKHEAVVNGQ